MTGLLAFLLLLSGDLAWSEFKTWFEKEGIPGAPAEVLAAGSSELTASGVSSEEAQAKCFNRIFPSSAAPFSREPSAFLKRVAPAPKAGSALDIAKGHGRNSIWLAKNGWTVGSYDLSGEGGPPGALRCGRLRIPPSPRPPPMCSVKPNGTSA